MRRGHKLLILWALYFVQGLPFGYQATALPTVLREHGVSLRTIGLAGALSLPWLLKPLWAPLIDRYGSERFGRRRGWILPLQLTLALCCLCASAISPPQLAWLLLLVFLMNLVAASMDIAVDGLAVDLLEVNELGYGNIAQVVGYKLGMLTGGGLLLWASAWIGHRGMFIAMAALIVAVLLVTLSFREPKAPSATSSPPALIEILRTLSRALRAPGGAWILIFIATYKLGESMADAMFKPWLIDLGFSSQEIGLWVGSWGMAFSIFGSLAGGLLASKLDLLSAVAITAVMRTGPIAAQWWLATNPSAIDDTSIIIITASEHFLGGALTTSMFAFMMSRVDRRIGATHFTVLAAIEVLGKSPATLASGYFAEAYGYAGLFGTATVLSVAFLALLLPLQTLKSHKELKNPKNRPITTKHGPPSEKP